MTFTHHLSLMHGWVPTTVQVVTAVILIAAVGRRTWRWHLIWLPAAAAVGAVLALGTFWYIQSEGLAGNPAPRSLWVWIAISGATVVVLVAGWPRSRWWRRGRRRSRSP